MWKLLTSTLTAVLLASTAYAQLLPSRLPELPVTVPGQLPSLDAAIGPSPGDRRVMRQLKIRELIRRHRDVIEPDPKGEPIVRGEVLAVDPSTETLALARAQGFEVLRKSTLEGLDITVVTLQVPTRMSAARALKMLRRMAPATVFDFNHIYTHAGSTVATTAAADRSPVGVAAARAVDSVVKPRIGLIDGGIWLSHPAFADATIRTWGCGEALVPSSHGTAVASLLIGTTPTFSGVAPSAELYAADVYCDTPTGGNVLALAAAFSWLAANDVPVINVSLVGPANATLERIVARLVSGGRIIVAAVGNDGPAAAPLYPAAYPGVVAVTGVDARQRVLLEACRGRQVTFAAPGADMVAATDIGAFSSVRGTSFAAPIVAALLSLAMREHLDAAAARAAVAATAIDLGKRGRDDIYGVGLVGSRYRIDPAAFVTPAKPAH